MISMIDFQSEVLKELVSKIKGSIRDNDMLVKYSANTLLLAYLVDKEDNALLFSKKLQELMLNERAKGMNFNLLVTLVITGEKFSATINRLNESKNERVD